MLVLSSSHPGTDCFSFVGNMLQLTKDLTEEMIQSRLVTVVVQVGLDSNKLRRIVKLTLPTLRLWKTNQTRGTVVWW